MNKKNLLFVAAASFLVASFLGVYAYATTYAVSQDKVTILSADPLNDTTTSDVFSVSTYKEVGVEAVYTYDSATDFSLAFECSFDGSTWSQMTVTDSSQNVSAYVPTFAVTASANFIIFPNIKGCVNVRVKSSSTSGTADDTLTVNVYGVPVTGE